MNIGDLVSNVLQTFGDAVPGLQQAIEYDRMKKMDEEEKKRYQEGLGFKQRDEERKIGEMGRTNDIHEFQKLQNARTVVANFAEDSAQQYLMVTTPEEKARIEKEYDKILESIAKPFSKDVNLSGFIYNSGKQLFKSDISLLQEGKQKEMDEMNLKYAKEGVVRPGMSPEEVGLAERRVNQDNAVIDYYKGRGGKDSGGFDVMGEIKEAQKRAREIATYEDPKTGEMIFDPVKYDKVFKQLLPTYNVPEPILNQFIGEPGGENPNEIMNITPGGNPFEMSPVMDMSKLPPQETEWDEALQGFANSPAARVIKSIPSITRGLAGGIGGISGINNMRDLLSALYSRQSNSQQQEPGLNLPDIPLEMPALNFEDRGARTSESFIDHLRRLQREGKTGIGQ